mgnify:CR=1 FL=1
MAKLDELVERYSSSGADGGAVGAMPHMSRLIHVPKSKTLIGRDKHGKGGEDVWLLLRTLTPGQEAAGSRGQKGQKGQPSGTETAMKWAEMSIARYYDADPGEEFDGKGQPVLSKHRDTLWSLLGPAGRGFVIEQYMELSGMLADESETDDEGNQSGES